jgi:hypothetical protein
MSNKDFDKSFLRDVVGENTTVDVSDPNNLSDKILPEKEYRKRILTLARSMGCEREMMLLFAKADSTMRKCSNEKERLDMGKLFCVEAYALLGGGGTLIINGQIVCKDR